MKRGWLIFSCAACLCLSGCAAGSGGGDKYPTSAESLYANATSTSRFKSNIFCSRTGSASFFH